MNHRLTTILALSAPALLLSACNESAYYPGHPTVPLVSAARQAEVSASLDQNGFGTARVSAAPVNHLLLTGAVSGRFWGSQQLREQPTAQRLQQHWEVGLGTFTRLGPHTTIGLLGGYGRGTSDYNRPFPTLSLSMANIRSQDYRRYSAATTNWFAQAHILTDLLPADADVQLQLGAAYRLSLVEYRRYSYQPYAYYSTGIPTIGSPQAYNVPNTLWHSLTFSSTLRLTALPALGLQTSLGLASPLRRAAGPADDDYLPEVSHYGRWVQGSVGLTVAPHLLLRRKTK